MPLERRWGGSHAMRHACIVHAFCVACTSWPHAISCLLSCKPFNILSS